MSTMDDDMSHDDADYGDGCEDGKPGLAAFLGGHVGLPVGQGFGFGGDAAGGAGGGERVARDRQVELVALAVAPEPVELFGRHHTDGVEPVPHSDAEHLRGRVHLLVGRHVRMSLRGIRGGAR